MQLSLSLFFNTVSWNATNVNLGLKANYVCLLPNKKTSFNSYLNYAFSLWLFISRLKEICNHIK